jgi:diaminopimelate epimerase
LSNPSSIPFVKASAYGNDFLIIDRKHQGSDPAALTRSLCNRHNGIGADGVEWTSQRPGAEVHIELINADGSFAELSGNGTRCVAATLAANQPTMPSEAQSVTQGGEEFVISTDAGPRRCRLTGRSGNRYDFLTEMGHPEVGLPFAVKVGSLSREGVPVSMGNPHFVIFVEEFASEWQRESQLIQSRADLFPEGVNVEWVQFRAAGEAVIRIFERGAGETQSSGTGTSAAASAAIAVRKAPEKLLVLAPGGAQRVEWHPGQPLLLEGSAVLICQGEFFL